MELNAHLDFSSEFACDSAESEPNSPSSPMSNKGKINQNAILDTIYENNMFDIEKMIININGFISRNVLSS